MQFYYGFNVIQYPGTGFSSSASLLTYTYTDWIGICSLNNEAGMSGIVLDAEHKTKSPSPCRNLTEVAFQLPELRKSVVKAFKLYCFCLPTLATNTQNACFRIDEIVYHSDWVTLGNRRLVIVRRNWYL